MKRYIFYSILFLSGLFGLQSCFDDDSSEATIHIPEIEIDTTGIPVAHYAVSGRPLVIRPNVTQEGSDGSNLSYEWKISMKALSYSSEIVEYFTVGTQMHIDTILPMPSATYAYNLWYQVTDNNTGIRKDIVWQIYVNPAYPEGLLVASTYDGSTSDLSYIKDKDFYYGWVDTSDVKEVAHKVYSEANGAGYPGLIKDMQCYYNSATGIASRRFNVITDKDFFQLDKEYKLVGVNHQVVFDQEMVIKPQQLYNCSSGNIGLVNNNEIYRINVDANAKPGISISGKVLVSNPDGSASEKYIYPDKMIATGVNSGGSWGCWYDKNNGWFAHSTSHSEKGNMTICPAATTPFDPSNCPGLETVYAGEGYGSTFYMIMKNGSKYQIYVIKRSGATAQALYEIPGTEINDAKYFDIPTNGNVIYFATSSAVYGVVLGGSTPEVKKVYDATAGEITHLSIFRHMPRTYNYYYTNYRLETHEYLLMVGESQGNNGTLTTIPIITPNVAAIDVAAKKQYTGFGRILDVVQQKN